MEEKVFFERLFYIHRCLKAGQWPGIKKMAEKYEVNRRTIERDLEFLRDRFNAPIEYDRSRRTHYYTDPSFEISEVYFREGELVAIFLGVELLRRYKGTRFEEPLQAVFDKLRKLLPARVSVDLTTVGQVISFDIEPLRGDEAAVADTFDRLSGAIKARRVVELDYYAASRDALTRRRVNPYHLRYAMGAWYLIGHCHLREDVRLFALDRIKSLGVTAEEFFPDPAFSVAAYLGDSWRLERGRPMEVVLRFDAYQARWIREKQWHPTQALEERPDGSLVMRVRVGGLGEMKRWVMQFGAHVEVLAPEELRREVAEEVARLAALYRPGAFRGKGKENADPDAT